MTRSEDGRQAPGEPAGPVTFACEGCGEPLRPTLRCTACEYGYCPYCFRGYWEECEHLVTAIRYDAEGGWIQPPFEADELPRLPAGVRLADYDEQEKQQALGKLAWLLDAWQWDEADRREYLDQYRLFELLLARVTMPVEPNASQPELAREEVGQFGWFSEQPDYVRWQISLLLGKLSKGVQRLLAEREG